MKSNFYEVFSKKKILLGMLHLAGNGHFEKLERVAQEIRIYSERGFDGAIVEDYHGNIINVADALEYLSQTNHGLIIGVNILRKPLLSFEMADRYGVKFVQFDTIQASAGDGDNPRKFNEKEYMLLRKKYPNICVLGGVRFKYIPSTGNSLEDDLTDGMYKSDAIVTTGPGTGIETPTQKLRDFRKIMGDFPLIAGAGVNDKNITEQIEIVDGVVMGSYLKNYDTETQIQEERVRKIVNLAR